MAVKVFLCRYCEQGYVLDSLLWCQGCKELAQLVDEVRAKGEQA